MYSETKVWEVRELKGKGIEAMEKMKGWEVLDLERTVREGG